MSGPATVDLNRTMKLYANPQLQTAQSTGENERLNFFVNSHSEYVKITLEIQYDYCISCVTLLMIKGTNFSAVHCITRDGINHYFY